MIELVVCIGIIMILVGFMLPALGRVREQAAQTRNLASVRGSLIFLNLYTDAHADRYPVGWTDPINAAKLWYLPLKRAGIIEALDDLGVVSEAGDRSLIALTPTAFVEPEVFVPGSNRHPYAEEPVAQLSSSVRYPSEKGILWQYLSESPDTPGLMWCCLPDAPLSPVAFADGSAVLCTYKEFKVDPLPEQYRRTGIPVVTTWSGLAGRDVLDR